MVEKLAFVFLFKASKPFEAGPDISKLSKVFAMKSASGENVITDCVLIECLIILSFLL